MQKLKSRFGFIKKLPLQPISVSEENFDPLIVILLGRVNDGRAVDLHPVDRLYHLQRKELSGNAESNRRKERFSEEDYLNSWDVSLIGTR